MRKLLALFVSVAVLFTCIPVYGLEMADLNALQNEEEFKQAIQGDPLWVQNFPNGLFNFVGTQYRLQESQKFLEIAIARQGGTAGNVSVDFKAIDVSAEYGKDYVIRVYENNKASEMQKNENAIPLIDTLIDGTSINISRPDEAQTVQQSVYSNGISGPGNTASENENGETGQNLQMGEEVEQEEVAEQNGAPGFQRGYTVRM